MTTRLAYAAAGILGFAAILLGWSIEVQAQIPKTYGGPGTCDSSGCHGSIWPKTGGRIGQNEYQIWATKDRHSKAYSVLLEPRSKQIARNLRIDKPETSATCLDCHATNVPVAERSTTFDLSDGVGCESCHGASAGWLQPHTTRNWTHDQSIKAGMTDLRDVKQRVEVCLSCHLGSKDKTVGHELIAAGHPDLIFELETFTALMPAHWQPANEKTDPMRRWAISQAISLRDSMEQMRRRVAGETRSPWPDFADFECSSCHHNLVTPSPRQNRGYSGRAGLPPWNESRYLVTRRLIGAIAPATMTDLDSRISELQKASENPSAARISSADSIKRVVDLINETLPQIERASFDASVATKILRNIAADADEIGLSGLASAEQATMSIDVLYNAAHPGRRDDAVNVQIDALYRLLQSKTGYDPEQFANALKKIGTLF